MLTKRTNILFDEKTWNMLVSLAKENNSSVGELVRNAVKDKYSNEEERIMQQRIEAIKQINAIRSQMKHTFTTQEILELVKEGRKYE